MKHIKLFEQEDWGDLDIDEFFGKEPELKLIRWIRGDRKRLYIIESKSFFIVDTKFKAKFYKNFTSTENVENYDLNPIISNDDVVVALNLSSGTSEFRFKDLPKEIKDRL